ncbi:MAG: PfkB family carbohydrate kinase, partial [Candidatus Dormiibacterota bacterium]
LNPAPPRPAGGDLLALVDVLTPNRIEATALAGLDPGAEPTTAARALRERGAGTVVVTLEAQGALCLHGDEARRLPGLAVPVRDTTGAGDAFTGALAVGLASGAGLEPAIALANRAGAFCVTRRGVVPGLGTRAELATLPGPGPG